MAWLTIDRYGDEEIYNYKPVRGECTWAGQDENGVALPKGSIEKLIGRKLTWEDDPVKL